MLQQYLQNTTKKFLAAIETPKLKKYQLPDEPNLITIHYKYQEKGIILVNQKSQEIMIDKTMPVAYLQRQRKGGYQVFLANPNNPFLKKPHKFIQNKYQGIVNPQKRNK